MELTTYDASNVGHYERESKPVLRLHRKQASSLSKGAVELIEFVAGEQLAVHQDPETGEWYISLSGAGYVMRDKPSSQGLYFNCAKLSKIILDHLNITSDYASFSISTEPVVLEEVIYWHIDTDSPIIRVRKQKDKTK